MIYMLKTTTTTKACNELDQIRQPTKLFRQAANRTNSGDFVRYVHNADRVGESGSLFPASDNDHRVAVLDKVPGLAERNSAVDPGVNVLEPVF